jgi:hypothetical protein
MNSLDHHYCKLQISIKMSARVVSIFPAPLTFFADIFTGRDFAGGGGVEAQAFVALARQLCVGHLTHFGVAFACAEEKNSCNKSYGSFLEHSQTA